MRGNGARQPAVRTRDRILRAAMLRFSKTSYDETGLREIAADVGVDVGYVHRCFGSKERLFAEALAGTLETRRFLAEGHDEWPDVVAKRVFSRRAATTDEVTPFDIILRSVLSPAASPALRHYVLKELIEPLAAKLGHADQRPAAVIAALLLGLGILRNVLQLDPLLEPAGGQLQKIVANAVDAILSEGVAERRREKMRKKEKAHE